MTQIKTPILTVDTFIYNESKEFVLIKRKYEPYKGYWALPGGHVEIGETVENAAIREAKEETNINIHLENIINVYSNPHRDIRGHTVSIAYTAYGNLNESKADSDASEIAIFNEKDLKKIKLAFDHLKIIKDALKII